MQQPSEFLALLEAERNDLSYRYGGKSREPREVINIVRPDKERELKHYNAGRFAAGARDKVAVAADKWLQREMKRK